MEIWKKIEGWDYYEVSNLGNVRSCDKMAGSKAGSKSLKRGRILKAVYRKDYPSVSLTDGLLRKQFTIHRLVAEAFLPKRMTCDQVNHINGIKKDNRVENLEWVDGSENMKHAVRMGLSKVPNKGQFNEMHYKSRRVIQMNANGEIVKEWASTREAHRNGFNCGVISRVCNNKLSTYKGFKWKYA